MFDLWESQDSCRDVPARVGDWLPRRCALSSEAGPRRVLRGRTLIATTPPTKVVGRISIVCNDECVPTYRIGYESSTSELWRPGPDSPTLRPYPTCSPGQLQVGMFRLAKPQGCRPCEHSWWLRGKPLTTLLDWRMTLGTVVSTYRCATPNTSWIDESQH